jgi:hypothetical protein
MKFKRLKDKSMKSKKTIVLELNELTPELINKFINAGDLPNFKKLRDHSIVYETDALLGGCELNPWVQWVTVHTGLPLKEHGVTKLNELESCDVDFIWDELSRQNKSSWVCGSMNSKIKEGFKGLLLPDPWATGTKSFPPGKFDDYYDFVAQSVREVSRGSKIPFSKFITFMINNGLSLKTIIIIIKQLSAELINKDTRWKRAMIMDWLQFDIFKFQFKKNNFDFSTFFSNSTAHFQHHYWIDMDPELFKAEEINSNRSTAILEAYQNMDMMLGEFFKLKDEETTLVFKTALSQQPYLGFKRSFYHIKNKETFFDIFGINQNVIYRPVMAEQFHLECINEQEADNLKAHLETFIMDNNSYFNSGVNKLFWLGIKDNIVHVQCACNKSVSQTANIIFIDGKELDFYNAFYEMDDVKSGMHSPIGMLWVNSPSNEHRTNKEVIPLEESYKIIMETMK